MLTEHLRQESRDGGTASSAVLRYTEDELTSDLAGGPGHCDRPAEQIQRAHFEGHQLASPKPGLCSAVDEGPVPVIDRRREVVYLIGAQEMHFVLLAIARQRDTKTRGSGDDAIQHRLIEHLRSR